MTRSPRNRRRAYDADGREILPMDLGNMRQHGVRSVAAHCQEPRCGDSGSVNVDDLPDDFPVPDVALRLRCSPCGSRNVKAVPAWREGQWARDYGSGRCSSRKMVGGGAV